MRSATGDARRIVVLALIAALLIGLLGARSRAANSVVGVLMPFGLGLGILALSRREAALGARQAADGQASGGRPALLAGAYVCFALCAAAVAYGLVLIAAP